MTFEQITKDIEKKNFAGIYYLTGEETYFTDKITHLLDEQVLDASEKDFNRDVLYGTETQVGHILNGCKRFPLLAERRLVIVKEAQGIDAKNWDKMLSYFKKPSPTTILVLAFKGKNKGLPKAAVKAIEENKGIHFEMKKMYERDAIKWVGSYIESRGFEAEVGVSDIIVGYLGLHLHHIENELEKIFIYLSAMKDKKLPKSLVYEMINIDMILMYLNSIKHSA